MPRNEEGEFELVLGNRQLLSVFFIVVVLLGVFFVMGYILGKNSTPAGGTDVATARKTADPAPAQSPIIIDKSASKSSAVSEPERPVEKAAPKKVEAKKAEPPPPPPPAPTSTGGVKSGNPPKGSLFLQVAAVGRAEADVLAKVLRQKSFDIWIAPTEKENIHRVLVGPIQKSDQGKVRTELEGLGFKPFPRSF